MSETIAENKEAPVIVPANAAVMDVLLQAPENPQVREYLNRRIKELGDAVKADSFDSLTAMYHRHNYTMGALIACDTEVRTRIRNRVDLQLFDRAIAIGQEVILAEGNRQNDIARKVHKALHDSYLNGFYK